MAYHLGDPSAPSEIVSREPKSNRSETREASFSMTRFRRFRLAAVPACFFMASLSLLAQVQQAPPPKPPQQQTPPAQQPPVNPFETAPRVLQTQPQLETPKPEAAPQLRP